MTEVRIFTPSTREKRSIFFSHSPGESEILILKTNPKKDPGFQRALSDIRFIGNHCLKEDFLRHNTENILRGGQNMLLNFL
jgi:hypothetical protein